MRHVQILSAPLPSGVTWLINCLLELGVRTSGYATCWLDQPEGSRLAPGWAFDSLGWYLPILHRQSLFHFQADDGLEVYWDHRLSFAQYPARKIVLYVRDPRDAAYSAFRRLVDAGSCSDSEADLLRYLKTPKVWADDFPPLFDLPPADTLGYYNLCCLNQVPAEQLLVVRFEDSKQNPLRQLQRVLAFLEITRSEAEIQQALANSQIEHFLALAAKMPVHAGDYRVASRAGRVGEWKTALRPAALACFKGPAAAAIEALGYEPLTGEKPAVLLPTESPAWVQLGPGPEAEALLQQAIQAAPEPEQIEFLLGQYLALLWTRALLGPAQSRLPSAVRMTRFFAAMNARYAALPQLQAVAAGLLEPGHALHRQSAFPAIYYKPEADFAQAAQEALAAGLPYLLWKPPELELDADAVFELCALLDGPYPDAAAAMPVILPTADDNASRAFAAHAHWGAEARRLYLSRLPECILFRCDWLKGLPLEQPPEQWLPALAVYQGQGVRAFRLAN